MFENKFENNIIPLVGIVMGNELDLKVMKMVA